jgi:hypothetical protein
MSLRPPRAALWARPPAAAARGCSPRPSRWPCLTLGLALAWPLCAQQPPAGPPPQDTPEAQVLPGTSPPLRDPTQVPVSLQGAADAAARARESEAGEAPATPRVLLQDGGRGYVLSAGRRYGVGDTWGEARIARITPHEVWLDSAGAMRREPLYPGVQKRPMAKPANEAARPAKPQRPTRQRLEKP